MDLQNLETILNNALTNSTEANVKTQIQSAIDLIEAEKNRNLEALHNDAFIAIQDLLAKARKTDKTNVRLQDFFGFDSKGEVIKIEIPYSQITETED
ncbi:hypothetical protein [Kaistella sp.]|uniref:hypothetical protein n=1 Tax=Kaistella sp. TaxID=2782235 RepID=UPI002F920EEC